MTNCILFFIGILLLDLGTIFCLIGSSEICKKLKFSAVTINLTVITLGSCLPGLTVSIVSGINHQGTLGLGAVLGGCLFQFCIVCGLEIMFYHRKIQRETLKMEYPFLLFSLIMLLFLMADNLFFGFPSSNELSRWDGVILFLLLLLYVFMNGNSHVSMEVKNNRKDSKGYFKYIMLGIAGIVLLIPGGIWTCHYALNLIEMYGFREQTMSFLIIGILCQIPYLIFYLKNISGNQMREEWGEYILDHTIYGNIFQMLLTYSITCMIQPINVYSVGRKVPWLVWSLVVYILLHICLWLIWILRKKVDRWQGSMLAAVFALFIVYISLN